LLFYSFIALLTFKYKKLIYEDTEMSKNLSNFSEEVCKKAMHRYYKIEPYFKRLESVKEISESTKVPIRALYNWINRYNSDGVTGLIDKARSNKYRINTDEDIKNEYFSTSPLYPCSFRIINFYKIKNFLCSV
jgi:transposase